MHEKGFPVFEKMNIQSCTGCEACFNVCPVDCISMKEDQEGFLFPCYDETKCINCGKCLKTCPVLNIKEKVLLLEGYAGYAVDHEIVKKSASGGMFGVLANVYKDITAGSGFISGVVWNNEYTGAEHILSNDESDLEKMRSSKYVQSKKNTIYIDIKKKLDEGDYVLFSGTPCEVAGLKGVLKLDYENLYTVDIVCQGPTSPKALREFIDKITLKGKKTIVNINMRHVKMTPWIPQWIKIDFTKGRSFCKLFYETTIGRTMHIMQRRSCYNCNFNENNRCSDITIGDFHGADTKEAYYNPYGTSIIILNTDKGKELFEHIPKEFVQLIPVDYDSISKPNPRIIKTGKPHPFRNQFGELFREKGLECAANSSWTTRQKLRMKIPYTIRLKVREIRMRRRKI